MKKSLFALIILLLYINRSSAQVDPHFSQYYASPLWLNPAMTGVIDGEARITANVKEQWPGMGGGYHNKAISGDARLSEKVAVGANVLDQRVGSAGFRYLSAHASAAYHLAISSNKYHKLSFAVQAGIINRGFDPARLQMDNQYNPESGFDPGLSNLETFNSTSATRLDANTGVFYYDGTPQRKINVFAGLAVSHLAAGKDQIAGTDISNRIPIRYTAHGGARISALGFLDITPHFIYMRQEKSQVRAAGINFEANLSPQSSLMLGTMYRMDDAAVGTLGLYVKNMVVGLSYDYNSSNLKRTSDGTYELSLSYVFKRKLSSREQKCPRL